MACGLQRDCDFPHTFVLGTGVIRLIILLPSCTLDPTALVSGLWESAVCCLLFLRTACVVFALQGWMVG